MSETFQITGRFYLTKIPPCENEHFVEEINIKICLKQGTLNSIAPC